MIISTVCIRKQSPEGLGNLSKLTQLQLELELELRMV